MKRTRGLSRLFVVALLGVPLVNTSCGDDGPRETPDGGWWNNDAGDAGDAARPDAGNVDAGDARVDAQADTGVDAGADAGGDQDAAPDAGPVADTWGYTSAKRLIALERATGLIASSAAVTAVPEGETLVGLDVRPADGTLIALSSAGKLYTIDRQSGVASLKSTLVPDVADTNEPYTALAGTAFGVDFNPVVDRLRVVSNTGQNLRINVDTGATTTDAALAPATPGLTAAAYTDSFASACRTRLLVIDATAGKLLLQNPPNDGTLSELASLVGGAIWTQLRGFDIATASDGTSTALVAGATAEGEYVATVDLTSGAIGSAQKLALATGETLEAVFALPPTAQAQPTQAPGELVATTANGRVISFNRAAPGKLCSSAAITGLDGGEEIVGADVRPADGALYGLGSQGRLYTIAVATGAATLKSRLSADPGDDSEPYFALVGAQFGVGFNPVPDRLRVISETGVNLRINPDTGATTTDIALNPGAPSVTAAAYTNSLAGAKTTTLYALDTTADALVRVGGDPATSDACTDTETTNPNCGAIVSVGALNAGGDVGPINGFDIEGRTGVALAALSIGEATTSTLLSVDLATGAASLPAGVANGTIGGGERVRSLSFLAAPVLTLWAVTADNRLISFAASTPGTSTKDVPITGLQASENVVGLDVRPLDGKLYAIGSSGRLYTLDTGTGAATQVAELSRPTGSSFTSLPTATYGLDFNPAADALRLVNGAADNFRLLPSARAAGPAGSTFVDTALTPTAVAVAAAYTNNYAGSASTTLFVIDGAAGMLYRQGGVGGSPSPNTGALSEVGALGVLATGDVSFDIAGGHNGIALAAVSTDGANSALYSVNLASGTATAYNTTANTIGSTGNAPLRGLAIELK